VKRVLVVDDRATSRELIRTVLENAGYAVSEARDGCEAVQIALQVEPDLVLLDLQMPTLDGFGALELLRADARFASLPIVAVTASAMQGDREKAGSEIIGVGRLSKLHGEAEAEFAVVIRDQFQGLGLGTELLRTLIEVARREEVARIVGYVLRRIGRCSESVKR
jgi:two-component system cell cycle response regulator DivK